MSIIYRIALEIPGEHREATATFTDFDRGAAACVAPDDKAMAECSADACATECPGGAR